MALGFCRGELPVVYGIDDVDISSIRLNDTFAGESAGVVAIHNRDGGSVFVVEFASDVAVAWLNTFRLNGENGKSCHVVTKVSGYVKGAFFEGYGSFEIAAKRQGAGFN